MKKDAWFKIGLIAVTLSIILTGCGKSTDTAEDDGTITLRWVSDNNPARKVPRLAKPNAIICTLTTLPR